VLLKILDRYLVREILPPLLIALVGLTFALMMPPILKDGEQLVAKGVAWTTILRALWTLTPSALCVTIPMALLFGILFGLGRLSADREFVALQACGISLFRVFRPIVLVAVLCCAATAYETIVAVPAANQTYREITFSVIASWADSDIKPRVFFQGFPNRVIYVRDVQPGGGGWRDVFLADDTQPDQTTVYFADRGRLVVDREKKKVELVLEKATRHTTFPSRPEDYDVSSYDTLSINMDADTVFPKAGGPLKGDNEKTIAELRAAADENVKRGAPDYVQRYTIQQKFSLPAACLVLALIGLPLGVSNRKDGKLGSFALGSGVIFVYYILLYSSRAMALGGRLQPTLAPWLANIVLFAAGVALVFWRARAADRPIRIDIPAFWRRRQQPPASISAPAWRRKGARRVVLVVRVPHIDWPRPGLLDFYISRQYLAVFGLAFVSLVGIFYISTFIDLADKLFRGAATTRVLLRFFYFQTPQYIYYIIPLSALVATLVTIGVLTKNSELIVMRACGISLYRSAAPMLLFAALCSLSLFELQEHVLADSNREAARLNAIIRNYPTQTFGILNRRWIVGAGGDIYHYEFFDPAANRFDRLSLFQLNHDTWKLDALVRAKDVVAGQENWEARQGWIREFTAERKHDTLRTVVKYTPFASRPLTLEPPSYFKTDEPEADRMTYEQLGRYVKQLQASGYHAVPYMVQLQRKVAFPFVTIVMTLLAVPFAASTGRSGTMFGIGVGIVLSIVYWIALSLFGALGAGGWISPVLGAWAPNIIFAAAALYLLLTVRT
jgi:LPS export ABC transporter permease LptG/LPS export ABC transporter permease LptF